MGMLSLIVALLAIVTIGWVLTVAAAAPSRVSSEVAAAPTTITLEPASTNFVQPAGASTPAAAFSLPTAAITTATPTAATATPSAIPTPAVPRVGLQVGHWQSDELPDELARLRGSTGAAFAGYTEAEVNLVITRRVAQVLEAQGVIVDVLPATVPISYSADAFVTIHADGSSSPATRGFKIAAPWRSSPASQHLLNTLIAEYAAATSMPQDDAITFNMRGYYAFSWRRFQHAISRTTPATIVEMGFLSSAADRALLIEQPDMVAAGIANGILRYLNERDVTDTAALEPPNISILRALSADGAAIRAAPDPAARMLATATPDKQLIPFELRNGWYQVVLRGEFRTMGWVRAEDVRTTNEPLPTMDGGANH